MSFGFGLCLPSLNYVASLFSPLSLFANGEQGAWYDPSDLTTLFQDSAGTTPVTAVEQPVGRMLDKSGRGNHAFQSTSASRPVLSARVNLLTKTEQFSDSVWAVASAASASTPTKGTTTGTRPDGTVGVIDTITYPAVGATQASFVYQNAGASLVNIAITESIYVRVASGSATVFLNVEDVAAAPSGGNFIAGTAKTVTTEWTQISLSGTRTSSSSNAIFVLGFDARANASQTNAAPVTIQVAGADLRVSNDGVGLPAYQRVNTSTDYDTAGFPLYLKTDGVDDWMQTNSINFTSTDKMTVWAGVRKLSDAARAIFAETGNSNDGIFTIFSPTAALTDYQFTSRGTSSSPVTASGYVAPISNVLACIGDISTPTATIRINGTQISTSTASQGTGTYGNYPLYLFRRAGTSLPFNGRFFGLIVRGAQSTASQIASGETYMNQKTKAY